jgi:hypothetical protein
MPPDVATPTLAEVQALVWKLLTAPEGVEKGIEDLVLRGELSREQFERWFAGDERLSASGRLDVYANMYFFRIRDVLAEDFPKTAAVLGPAHFHNLITDFLLVHPSSHPSLRWVGEPLPLFLRTHPLSAERPYLADLAALEWAGAEVFQAIDSPRLDPRELAAVPVARWGDVRFRTIAAVRLLRLSWDVVSLWSRLAAGEEAGEVRESPRAVLVYREDDESHHEVLSPPEADVVERLIEGRAFGEICEALSTDDDVEAAAALAAELIRSWMAHGLLSGIALE